MCTDLGLSKSLMTDLKSGRKKGVTAVTANKIANYFGVSIEYLLGQESTHIVTDAEIKVALFGSRDISDETLQEVRRYAQYLMTK